MSTKTVTVNGREIQFDNFDCMDFIPYHEGPDVIPHDLIFHSLRASALREDKVAIIDSKTGYHATYSQLLSDVVICRNSLRDTLAPETLEALKDGREVSLLVWSEGYEFVVAFFAIFAIGAIVVPFSPHITIPEALCSLETVAAHGILTSSSYKAKAVEVQAQSELGSIFKVVETTPYLYHPVMDLSSLKFQSGLVLDQNKPCLVIFSSGSTGLPKGVAICWIENETRLQSKIVEFLPTHHATGLLYNTIPTLVSGGCVEFDQGNFNPASVWERIRRGDLKTFSAVLTIYVRLLRHWELTISQLPNCEEYKSALSRIRYFASSTSALPRSTAEKWLQLSGHPISERYGGSEFGNVYMNSPGRPVVPGSVGTKNLMSESKLSEGDYGEVLVRGPMIFAKYINDPLATSNAFDENVFFKTGDMARCYFIEGRASVDGLAVLKSGGYKISALDVERVLNSHPKIAEGIVVDVDDEELGQRVAAAVVLKNRTDTLTLAELRRDLRDSLTNYKLPTMLRVVRELRKTHSMKVPKKLIKEELFGSSHPDIQVWDLSSARSESKL